MKCPTCEQVMRLVKQCAVAVDVAARDGGTIHMPVSYQIYSCQQHGCWRVTGGHAPTPDLEH